MTQENESLFVAEAWSGPGGRWIEGLIDEMALEDESRLLHLMDTKPDTLTGKTAIKLAAGRKRLKDLKERIYDKIRTPQPHIGAGR